MKPLNTEDAQTGPMHTINLDFVWGLPGVQGKTGFLTVIDGFSKHVSAYPLKTSCTSNDVAACLRQWSHVYGIPGRVRYDQDKRFTAAVLQEVLKLSGVKAKFSSGYHPVANGIVERVQQTLVQMLRASVLSTTTPWTELLPACCFALNSVPHASTGCSPNSLVFGRELADIPLLASTGFSPEAYRQAKEQARLSLQAAGQEVANRTSRSTWVLRAGDKVWLATKHLSVTSGVGKKLVPKYVGPFTVLRATDNTATLDLPPNFKCRPTWHLSFLKPFIPDEWFSSGNVTDFGLSYDDIVESPDIPAPIEDQVETPSVPVQAEDNVDWHLDLFEDD